MGLTSLTPVEVLLVRSIHAGFAAFRIRFGTQSRSAGSIVAGGGLAADR